MNSSLSSSLFLLSHCAVPLALRLNARCDYPSSTCACAIQSFLFESRRFSARWECEERAARCFGLSSMVLSFFRQISASRGRESEREIGLHTGLLLLRKPCHLLLPGKINRTNDRYLLFLFLFEMLFLTEDKCLDSQRLEPICR